MSSGPDRLPLTVIGGYLGAGKTTLVNLLLRLYDVEGGRITIDGQDIADNQFRTLQVKQRWFMDIEPDAMARPMREPRVPRIRDSFLTDAHGGRPPSHGPTI